MRDTVAILGVPIDDLDMDQVLDRLVEFVRSGRFHQVATANTDFIVRAQSDPELLTVLRQADLVVADGMPVVQASRWLRSPLRERVAGADLVPRLAALAAANGHRIFLLGARPEVAQAARDRLVAENPGLQIVGCLSPPMSSLADMDHECILDAIRAAEPDLLLVAFGNPKQEKWIHMHRHRLRVPVCIGIGGTLDFVAGATVRAPAWMQQSGLEWLHRLLHEPRRLWRRYAVDAVQFGRLMAALLGSMRTQRRSGGSRLAEATAGDCTVLSASGKLGADLVRRLQSAADRALQLPSHVVLDLQAVGSVDGMALGALLNLPKRAAYVGRDVRIVGEPAKLRRTLELSHVHSLIKVYATVAEALQGDPPSDLEARVTAQGSAAVVSLHGRADVETAERVADALAAVPGDTESVYVDLRDVPYVDTAVLTVLRRHAKAIAASQRKMRLVAGGPTVRTLEREHLLGAFELVAMPDWAEPAHTVSGIQR